MRTEIGDYVSFKSGIEMSGRVTKNYATAVDVDVWNGETGQYDRHHVARSKLWRE